MSQLTVYKKRAIKAVRRKRYSKRKTSKMVKMIRRVARSVVSRNNETKQVTTLNDIYFNSSISAVSEFYSLIPAISQGVGDYQRIGQKIRMKYLTIKGSVSYETAIGTTNNLPIYVDMFVLADKIQKSQNSSPHDYRILNASGSPVAYNGTGPYSHLPVNTEEFTLVKRIRKKLALNWAPGNTSTTITDPNQPLRAFFKLKIPVNRKVADYESASANLPQNCNYWLAAGFTQYTDSTQTAAPLRIQWAQTLYYTDA